MKVLSGILSILFIGMPLIVAQEPSGQPEEGQWEAPPEVAAGEQGFSGEQEMQAVQEPSSMHEAPEASQVQFPTEEMPPAEPVVEQVIPEAQPETAAPAEAAMPAQEPAQPAPGMTPAPLPALPEVPETPTPPEEPVEEDKELADSSGLSDEQRGFRGNWVKKKDWLIRAQKRNKKIQELIKQIRRDHTAFQEDFYKIDDEFDTFFVDLGVDKEKVNAIFASIENYLAQQEKSSLAKLEEKEQTDEGLTPQEQEEKRQIMTEAAEFKKSYEAFKVDMASAIAMNAAIQDHIKQLEKYVGEAMDASENALTKYEEIWEIIDDTKAEAHYFAIKNDRQKVQNVAQYLTSKFKPHFDAALQSARETMQKIKTEIEGLESKDLIIKNREKRLSDMHVQREEDALTAKKQAAEVAAKQAEAERLAAQSWYQRLWNWILSFFW